MGVAGTGMDPKQAELKSRLPPACLSLASLCASPGLCLHICILIDASGWCERPERERCKALGPLTHLGSLWICHQDCWAPVSTSLATLFRHPLTTLSQTSVLWSVKEQWYQCSTLQLQRFLGACLLLGLLCSSITTVQLAETFQVCKGQALEWSFP